MLLTLRTLHAFDGPAKHYPLQRTLRLAVGRPLEEFLDDLALGWGLRAQRLDERSMVLDGHGVFARVMGLRKAEYSSITVEIWADTPRRLTAVRSAFHRIARKYQLRGSMFTIDWHFVSAHAGLSSASFEELADPIPFDEAYPTLREPVADFIDRFLDSRETVLILQGPPGTGKTRLVRAILATMSARKRDNARAIYTADRRALESDEMFVEFITGSHDAIVVEDADQLLTARADGNQDMHRFLAVADGVVRAQGRKIIFTTNLPNIGDIDAALVRPGRCFGVVRTRALSAAEALALLDRVPKPAGSGDRSGLNARVAGRAAITLAELYRELANAEASWED